jgi:hypothetical protein
MRPGITVAFFSVFFFALLAASDPARASGEEEEGGKKSADEGEKGDELKLPPEPPPIVRVLVAGMGGACYMADLDESGTQWSYAAGVSAELSLAGPGLTPLLQAGYFFQNTQWFHAIPVDIGGRYAWIRGKVLAYVSGGMSVFTFDKKKEGPDGETDHDWEVTPLVYIDLGTRLMFKRHVGLEIRLEYRTYIVNNIIGLKIGIAI